MVLKEKILKIGIWFDEEKKKKLAGSRCQSKLRGHVGRLPTGEKPLATLLTGPCAQSCRCYQARQRAAALPQPPDTSPPAPPGAWAHTGLGTM